MSVPKILPTSERQARLDRAIEEAEKFLHLARYCRDRSPKEAPNHHTSLRLTSLALTRAIGAWRGKG